MCKTQKPIKGAAKALEYWSNKEPVLEGYGFNEFIMKEQLRASRVTWGLPPATPLCLLRREMGLSRNSYRALCLAMRSVCTGVGRRHLRRLMIRSDAGDAEYYLDRVSLHMPAQKNVLVAPAFGQLDMPSSFRPFFSSDVQRKDDRDTAVVERPHPYKSCRPLAFSVHCDRGVTAIETIDIGRRRVEHTMTVAAHTGEGAALRTPAFKYIHHDLERNELVMRSKETPEVLASVVIFRMEPLEFLVHFQILRSEFPHVDSASVAEGVVMLTSRSRRRVYLFSLDTILETREPAGRLEDGSLSQHLRLVLGRNQRALALPINGRLSPQAPPLAEFTANQGYLELGATPFHTVTRCRQGHAFEVRALSDDARVLTTDFLETSVTQESATFIDDGPYMVQQCTSELRVFDLKSGRVVLHVDAAHFGSMSPPTPAGPVTTRSGRCVRAVARPSCVQDRSDAEWWLAWDIEDELDILAVVLVEEEEGCPAALRRLLLYDRQTWTLLSETPLSYRMPWVGGGLSKVSIVMDRCLLFVNLRTAQGKCAALVYSFAAAAGDSDQTDEGSEPARNESSRERGGGRTSPRRRSGRGPLRRARDESSGVRTSSRRRSRRGSVPSRGSDDESS